MANKTIKGFHDTNIVVKTSHTNLTVDENATLMSGKVDPGSGPGATVMEDITKTPIPSHNTFNINGEIIGYEIGLMTGGVQDAINIGKTGEIEGAVAVYAIGDKTHIENQGHLVATAFDSGAAALVTAGNLSHVQNDGSIEGFIGISTMSGDGVTVVNGDNGVIRAVLAAVSMQTNMGSASTFINHGTLLVTATNAGTDTFAFAGGSGNETVTNDGTMTGNVGLGAGDDKLTNSSMIDGFVDLGDGANVLKNHGGTICGPILGSCGTEGSFTAGLGLIPELPVDVL